MSIRKARLNGKTIYSMNCGEELRGKDIRCCYCNALMTIKRFPHKENEYYFALLPNESHSLACDNYDGKNDAPVFVNQSPIDLIKYLAKVEEDSSGGNPGGGNPGGGNPGGGDKTYKPKKITDLKQIIKTGMYYERPFDETFFKSKYKFVDFVIFDKWARIVWENKQLVNIGARVIDARWVCSMPTNLLSKSKSELTETMKETQQMWFVTFWRVGEKYHSVKYCVGFDYMTGCFTKIVKKLFTKGVDENGGFDCFVPKTGEKLDVLIAAEWANMDGKCNEDCPFKSCEGCMGAYWGKCKSVKQIELFPASKITKNKELKTNG